MTRLETGVARPLGDWPGIFMRGDDAFGAAITLENVIDIAMRADREFVDDLQIQHARRLVVLLRSCQGACEVQTITTAEWDR